ncbi:site-specific integrase [Halorussus gelatinilyticus]|uniref:Site-specific integrase n=1 Tax=Halorussus gelatinilyticus TaxID=2937524 RepID=A0A8U0IKI6_9EURY|nr:site-specific integrase [Halorussus gelatinilyticus]UPW01657.1 site-specific integrase [Halorussus gelatinilyticus]
MGFARQSKPRNKLAASPFRADPAGLLGHDRRICLGGSEVTESMNSESPEQALTIYLEHRETELSPESLSSYEYRLNYFLDWCDQNDIDDISDITPRDIHDFKAWRRDEGADCDGELAKPTLKSNMDCLRGFLEYLERLNYAQSDIHESAESPTLKGDENVRDHIVTAEQAEAILTRLDRYSYASKPHMLFVLAWSTGARTGALRSLDLADYGPQDEYVEFVHRPDTDTRLKNGSNGERMVALRPETCAIIDDYIAETRPNVTDEYGRKPLLATKHGRMAANTIRGWIYRLTRPCWWGDGCPHDRDQDDCKAATNDNYSYECPSTTGPHSVRRGAITTHLNADVPREIVSDRAQVSESVLEKHYDGRSEREKMEQRRGFLDNI